MKKSRKEDGNSIEARDHTSYHLRVTRYGTAQNIFSNLITVLSAEWNLCQLLFAVSYNSILQCSHFLG